MKILLKDISLSSAYKMILFASVKIEIILCYYSWEYEQCFWYEDAKVQKEKQEPVK